MRSTILLLAWLAACGADERNPGVPDGAPAQPPDAAPSPDAQSCGEACANHCPSGTETTLTGVVLAPNGIDPVAGASVYVPLAVSPLPDHVTCELCGDVIANAAVLTHTAPDGTFSLGQIPTAMDPTPGATISVIAQKGRFRRRVEVQIQSWCSPNAAPDGTFVLPGKHEDDTNTMPKIAVVSGMYDEMECVLTKLGIQADQIDLYAGAPLEPVPHHGNDFLRDAAALSKYNIVFINCGNAYELELLLDDQVKNALRTYVQSGGRLYVTDQSYDFIEEVSDWAGIIDFGPGASGNMPETMNAAELGDDGISSDALVGDATMVDWLHAVEARTGEHIVDPTGHVHIQGFVGGWAMQYAVANVDSSKVWIAGPVSGVGLSGNLPLTTSFDVDQCGRVLYSSYHTLGRPIQPLTFPDYCAAGGTMLLPQERLLEYLILQTADCIIVQ